jgi:purine-nucleoside/S-methyl-5'-thioadenosine phosphorylase / adenosine deaminase
MRWRERDGVEWLEAELPSADTSVAKAAFSTRSAGSVKDDLTPLAAALGLEPRRIAVARQVHGVHLVVHRDGQPGEDPAEADGHVLSEPGVAALVHTADCLPVAVSGPRGAAILHCGWRGLAAGIVGRGAAQVDAAHAAIGPGIGPCCYEVGDEVLGAFDGLGPGIADGRMLDLAEVARRLLREAGVAEIDSAGLCTSCEAERFFSHRRDGGPGRQAGIAWLEEES